MTQMIQIRPTLLLRRAFAEWAVGQRPKIRTVSTFEFAVPAGLFVDVPESVLIGALVDGHRYVSPVEDAALGRPEPGELLGVATVDGLTATVLEDSSSSAPGAEASDGAFSCPGCGREFTTERGRDLHARAKHPEVSDGS